MVKLSDVPITVLDAVAAAERVMVLLAALMAVIVVPTRMSGPTTVWPTTKPATPTGTVAILLFLVVIKLKLVPNR